MWLIAVVKRGICLNKPYRQIHQLLIRHIELMYKSTLINLVSNAECFLGDILKKYFSLYKGEVDGKLIEEKEKV